MKRIIAIFIGLLINVIGFAQEFDKNNSHVITALVYFTKGTNGLYHETRDTIVASVNDIIDIYAYDNKNKSLYLTNQFGNYVVSLNKEDCEKYKSDKQISKYKTEQIERLVSQYSKGRERKFENYNSKFSTFIKDSTNLATNISKLKEEYKKGWKELAEEYASNHNWGIVPTDGCSVSCSFCGNTFKSDYLNCLGASNDSLYFISHEHVALGEFYPQIHKAAIDSELKSQDWFKIHYGVFKDSLNSKYDFIRAYDSSEGETFYYRALDKVLKIAPYGYIESWSWAREYNNVSLKLNFMNLSQKTIKYINVFFSIKNAVDDVRCTGNVKGTGPVESGLSGSWNWDTTQYYTSGDSNNMSITKIILTYMDNSTRTITYGNLSVNYDREAINDMKAKYAISNDNKISEAEYSRLKGIQEKRAGIETYEHKMENLAKDYFEIEPKFPGGNIALHQYVYTHQKYPIVAQENGVQGNVVVGFIVEQDGSIGKVEVVRNVDVSLDREAERIIKSMPKWIPGMQDGKPVKAKMYTTVEFKLE